MNKKRDLDWAEIEITGDDAGTSNLKLDLEHEQENDTDVKQAPQDTRRTNVTVSKNNNENQENKNNKTRTEVEEDQDEGTFQSKQTRQAEINRGNSEVDEDDEDSPRKPGRAQRRIQNLTRVKNELAAQVEQLARENIELKKRTFAEQKRNASQMRDQFKRALDDAETQLEQAITSNDTAKVAKLSRQIADLTMRHNAYEAVTEDLENTPEVEEKQQVAPVQEVPDEAKFWIKRNPWFFQDEVRHVAARKISRDLSEEGVDPHDKEYWDELDKRLKKQFNEKEEEVERPAEKQGARKGPVSSTRSEEDVGGYDFKSDPQFKRTGNRVQANPTKSDYEMAERLGISIEDQMKEKFKYAKQGYTGYVPIDIPGQ